MVFREASADVDHICGLADTSFEIQERHYFCAQCNCSPALDFLNAGATPHIRLDAHMRDSKTREVGCCAQVGSNCFTWCVVGKAEKSHYLSTNRLII